MQCYRQSPEDAALRCTRTSTTRFGEQVIIDGTINGTNRISTYAYTCTQHAEHGPALVHTETSRWSGRQQVLMTTSTWTEVYDPDHEDSNGDGWRVTVGVKPGSALV